jgi:hypothetical protein
MNPSNLWLCCQLPQDLLIRKSGHIVQSRPLRSVRWADIPELSAADRGLSGGLAAVLATVAAEPL